MFQSKKFQITFLILGFLLALLVSFALGVKVGLHKAKFSYLWGKNYEQNFLGPNPRMSKYGSMGEHFPPFDEFNGRDFRNPHGLAGEIISIVDNKLVIKDRDNKENTVIVDDKTLIKLKNDDLKLNDLKTGDEVVIMGRPDENGVIQAVLIRIFEFTNN